MDRERVRRALVVVGGLYVVSGVLFVALSFAPAALDAVVAAVLPGARCGDGGALMTAVGGGLTAGLGGILVALGRARVHDPATALRAVVAGVLTWFVIDSSASIAHGAWRNAVANLAFLALGLLPWALAQGGAERPLDGLPAADSASRG